MNVTYNGSTMVRPDVRTFYFEAGQPFRYVAGQFVDLTVPHKDQDERGDWRQFSLSSSPTEPQLAITMRFEESGGSSFKRALLDLQPGAIVHMSEAMGDFVLPLSDQTPLVFIAGGIGITPFRSMAKWLSDTGEHRQIELLHFSREHDKLMFDSVLSEAGATRNDAATHRLDAGSIAAIVKDPDRVQYYISGPESMVKDLHRGFRELGIEPYRIVTDEFLGYTSA